MNASGQLLFGIYEGDKFNLVATKHWGIPWGTFRSTIKPSILISAWQWGQISGSSSHTFFKHSRQSGGGIRDDSRGGEAADTGEALGQELCSA